MAEFTLQLLHATDQEGAAPALVDAPNLSAVLNALKDDYENTLILSAGDLWLPGLFYSASAEVYGFTNEDGEFEGIPGIADVLINNALGIQAAAFGNHEFDQGTGAIAALLQANPAITGPGIGAEGYQGTAFPYLSANLDFSADPNLADLVVADGQDVDAIEGNIAKSAVTTVGGEKIGIVGATTPTLPTVSSPGDEVAVSPADPDDFAALAATIQDEVDALLTQHPDLNKVILLSHMQLLDIEVNELAPRLSGVDIIIGGGSDTILADATDRLRDGDAASGPYPIFQEGADGNPIAIVNTDGQYLYVGQLVVDFNEDGVIITDSIDPLVSGAYATDAEGVAALEAAGLTDPVVTEVIAALNDVIEEKERNVFGITEVFLNGRRAGGGLDGVRSQETNLGNLTAEANLWYARLFDEDVDISIKNGGGIRESIGAVVTPPGATAPVRVPPEGNPLFGKPAGGITQTDVESVLAFNNGLSVVTTTVEELKAILEHTVSGATEETINSDFGSFGQVAGIQFSFDIAFEPGNRVRSLTLVDDEGNDTEVLVQNGEIQGDPTRTYRLVTLNFLADGGSGYPIPQTDRVDLVDFASLNLDSGLANFADAGSEQDAFAEYLATFFPADEDPTTPVFRMADTPVDEDERIQNLFFRADTVIDDDVPPISAPEDPTEPETPDFSDGFAGPFSEIGRLILSEGAEINAFDPASATLFVVSGGSILQAVDLSDPASPVLGELIDLGVFGAGVNSVAVNNGVVALAVEARTSTDEGSVVFLTPDGQFLESVQVGAVPDIVTFTPDGNKVLVANEGEPNEDYSVDPEGSISIIDISNGAANATIMTADFTAFNDQKAELQAEGVKLFGPGATVAEDLEPEYIAVSPDGTTAWVTLQENNAIAVVDIENAVITDVLPLGFKDFSQDAQLDASNEDGGINIRNWPVFGLYQPDSIASYEVDGTTYYVTANEGDARIRPDGGDNEGEVFNEENRIGDDDIELDPEVFPNADELQQDENLGRLKITNTLGDADDDGKFEQLFAFGGRSFSIWDENGNLVFDSGDDIANITAQLTPELFNANDGDPEEFDNRSDDKGAEPEALTIGQIGGKTYAFVGLERAGGGVLVYDVTNPLAAEFVQYFRSDEDIAPEGLTFVPSEDSPNGQNLLLVTNEESSTLAVYAAGDDDGGNGGAGITAIYDIQGAGHTSSLVGETVTTTGLVTAVESNGFYLQDAEGDDDIATSDALFVFTDDAPGVAIGDELNVTGTVSEFTPGGVDTGNLSTTQISGDVIIEALSSGNELPAAISLGAGGRIPPNVSIDDDAFTSFDPETDGIDFFESLEAMRVTAQEAVAIAGTNRFGEIFAVVDGGESATGISDRGTLNISPDDFNPERVQIDADSDLLPNFDFPDVDTGAALGDVTGVISYDFGNFQINPTEPFTPSASSLVPEVSAIVKGDETLTVATYNVLNLDPNDADGDEDIANGRFATIAEQIVSNLNAPDIIGLQEIQDNSGADDDGTVAADETLQLLVEAIAVAGGPQYAFIDNTFIADGASGGQPGGNIRTAFLYNPERVGLVEDSVQPVGDQSEGSPFAGARLPLAATFEFNGEDVTIVNNHFSSKGGSAPILGVEQPFEQRQEEPDVNGSLNERRVQAQAVNDFVDTVFAEDADANVVVLGDLNEFEFISPLDILAGTVESTDEGFGTAPTGETAILTNLVNDIAPDERYSFIFQGNSQVLDHILVSDGLLEGAEIDFVNVNAEFAETDSRASDHEPLLASFDFSDDRVMPVEELLDLTGFDGEVTASLTLSREAAFDNILQFYETDAEGAVNGKLPGEMGYEDAVRQNLISGLELFVENLTTTDTDVLIGGGTYYAPALLVDGDPQNLVTIDDAAMGMSMIQREDNVWRFEDLTDFDFNDFVLTLNSAEAAASAT